MINVNTFKQKKQNGSRLSMVTCYDAWSAGILNSTDVDCLLVEDSLAVVMVDPIAPVRLIGDVEEIS